MTIYVKHSWEGNDTNDEILKQLLLIKNQNSQIMALIDDLQTQVADLLAKEADLQTSVDTLQGNVATLLASNAQVVTDLNTQIADLTAQLAAGATPAQLQTLVDNISTATNNILTTKADVESTPLA